MNWFEYPIHYFEEQARFLFLSQDFFLVCRFSTMLLLLKFTRELVYKCSRTNIMRFLVYFVHLCMFVYLVQSHCFQRDKGFFLISTIIESWLNYNQKPINYLQVSTEINWLCEMLWKRWLNPLVIEIINCWLNVNEINWPNSIQICCIIWDHNFIPWNCKVFKTKISIFKDVNCGKTHKKQLRY